jgi:inward rectifier potassium channel
MATRHFEDLGFGTKGAESRVRLINRDGSFNVHRKGLPFLKWFSAYHYLIQIPWWKFNLLIVAAYVAINAMFGVIYMVVGLDGMTGIDGHTTLERYMQSIFFSSQTLTTVGFGRIAPVSYGANITAAFESLVGLMSLALATGLLYGRFARPVAKIIFSRHALIAPYENLAGFMFRVANQRTNQLIEVEATLNMSRLETTSDGRKIRKFHELLLERDRVNFFHLSWTVVHPIDERSPIYGVTKEELEETDAEFLIMLKGFDDTFSQDVHARTSYKAREIMYGRKFKSIIRTAEDGFTEIDLAKIHDHEEAPIIGRYAS